MFRHINLVNIYPERIMRKDKELVNGLNYKEIGFPVSKNDFSKIEVKKKIVSMFFAMKIN